MQYWVWVSAVFVAMPLGAGVAHANPAFSEAYVHQVAPSTGALRQLPSADNQSAYVPQLPESALPRPAAAPQGAAQPRPRQQRVAAAAPAPAQPQIRLPSVGRGVTAALTQNAPVAYPDVGPGVAGL